MRRNGGVGSAIYTTVSVARDWEGAVMQKPLTKSKCMTDRHTHLVTSSLLELLIAAKNSKLELYVSDIPVPDSFRHLADTLQAPSRRTLGTLHTPSRHLPDSRHSPGHLPDIFQTPPGYLANTLQTPSRHLPEPCTHIQ